MSTEIGKYNTGIPELDNILNDNTGLAIEPMPIDKNIFDSALLPLLRNEVNLSGDETFTHIRNIWVNYYTNYSKNRAIVYKENSGLAPKSMGGNAVFTPMEIKDKDGTIVAVTPPLIEPTMIVGINAVLEEYSNEMKHNPNVAKVKLINTIKQYTLDSNEEWINFLKTYGSTIETDGEIDNDDLIIRS